MISNPTSGLLARELSKLGVVSRRASDEIATAMNPTLGERAVTTFPPHECFQLHMRVSGRVAAVLLRARAYLASHGRIADETQTGTSPVPHVSGVLRCGLVQKIPALVHVEVLNHEADLCLLAITAVAKEGPFQQQAARIAVQRVSRHIGGRCGSSSLLR